MTSLKRRVLSLLLILAILQAPLNAWANAAAPAVPATETPAWDASNPQQVKEGIERFGRMIEAASGASGMAAIGDAEWRKKAYENIDSAERPRTRADAIKGGAKAIGSAIAHNSQTVLVVWLITTIEATRMAAKDHKYRGKKLSAIETAKIAVEAGDQLLNNMPFFSSMVGGVAAGAALRPALTGLAATASQSTARKALQTLLHSGALSLGTFVGFELTGMLVHEAQMMLEPAEYMYSQKMEFMKIISGQGSEYDNKIFRKIMWNMFKLMIFGDPKLSAMWIYNTWRMRIATGDFVALVGTMVAAGMAVGTIAPGLGTFVSGLFSAILGGAMYLLLPKEYLEDTTDLIRRGREVWNRGDLGSQVMGLQMLASGYIPELMDGRPVPAHMLLSIPTEDTLPKLLDGIKGLSFTRKLAMTAQIERYYTFHMQEQLTKSNLAVIKQAFYRHGVLMASRTPPPAKSGIAGAAHQKTQYEIVQEYVKEESERLKKALAGKRAVEDEMMAFYTDHYIELYKLITDPKLTLPAEYVEAVALELVLVEQMHQYLRQLISGISPERMTELNVELDTEVPMREFKHAKESELSLYYQRGFKELIEDFDVKEIE